MTVKAGCAIALVLAGVPRPDMPSFAPVSIAIHDPSDERRIPRGDIVVRLTSDERPGQFVEHRSNPTPQAYLSCEEAIESWELPDAWETD